MDTGFWETVINVRSAVSRELERLRVAGGIGSSLNAEVDLYCEPALRQTLGRLGGELRFLFICSETRVHPLESRPSNAVETPVHGLSVQVAPSAHAKCARCWHQRPDVGSHPEHPLICARCVQNLGSPGENRSYA